MVIAISMTVVVAVIFLVSVSTCTALNSIT
jgi:hypothetical protein